MSDEKVNYTVHKLKMPDTGIGRAAAYKDDDELRAAIQAEREAMDPEVRAAIEDHERRAMNTLLFGNEEGVLDRPAQSDPPEES